MIYFNKFFCKKIRTDSIVFHRRVVFECPNVPWEPRMLISGLCHSSIDFVLCGWRRKFDWWKPKPSLAVGAWRGIPQNNENRSKAKVRKIAKSRSVFHLSTKTENSGWKFKGTAHSTGKFSKKMEILRRMPLFPFQPKWPEKSCTICKLPFDPVHFGLFSCLSPLQMQLPFWLLLFSSCREQKDFLGPLFGRSLATASFCHGRDLGPSNVNWQNGAVCAFFEVKNTSLLLWIRIILENCASKCETWQKASSRVLVKHQSSPACLAKHFSIKNFSLLCWISCRPFENLSTESTACKTLFAKQVLFKFWIPFGVKHILYAIIVMR